tara:strand:- start:980 stop:1150 length:171 start_codon:yes stop_codon:yes gene_type:complete
MNLKLDEKELDYLIKLVEQKIQEDNINLIHLVYKKLLLKQNEIGNEKIQSNLGGDL